MKIDSQTIKKNSVVLALSLCVIGALSGCSTIQSGSNTAKAVGLSRRLTPVLSSSLTGRLNKADLPFQKVWIKPGFDKNQYKELVVAPVNTQYMLKMGWLHRLSSANWIRDVKRDIDELALYFHNQIVKDFQADPNHRFQVIDYRHNISNRLCVWNSH